MVAYLDCIFLLNATMDYLLCLITARLAGISLRRLRYGLAALLGGIYAVTVFLPGGTYLSLPPVKIVVGVLLTLIAYGGEKRFFRIALLFWLIACLLAGTILGLSLLFGGTHAFYTNPSALILVFASLGVCVILKFTFQTETKNGLHGKLVPMRICISGNVCSLMALWDTGNQLQDPVSGNPVLVVAPKSIVQILPKELQTSFQYQSDSFSLEQVEMFRKIVPELKPRLIPYRALGTSSGLLLAIRTDWVEICGVYYRNVLAGFAPSSLGKGCDALWGGDLKGGKHENTEAHSLFPESEAKFETGDLLYWRK